MRLSCKLRRFLDKINWKYLLLKQQQKQKKKTNIMASHIKSHRLVAFLIYSSLSIYASHGKKEYNSNVGRERSIWRFLLMSSLLLSQSFARRRRRTTKIMLSGLHAGYKKNVSSLALCIYRTFTFEIFLYFCLSAYSLSVVLERFRKCPANLFRNFVVCCFIEFVISLFYACASDDWISGCSTCQMIAIFECCLITLNKVVRVPI